LEVRSDKSLWNQEPSFSEEPLSEEELSDFSFSLLHFSLQSFLSAAFSLEHSPLTGQAGAAAAATGQDALFAQADLQQLPALAEFPSSATAIIGKAATIITTAKTETMLTTRIFFFMFSFSLVYANNLLFSMLIIRTTQTWFLFAKTVYL